LKNVHWCVRCAAILLKINYHVYSSGDFVCFPHHGQTPPKIFLSVDKAQPNSQFRGKYILRTKYENGFHPFANWAEPLTTGLPCSLCPLSSTEFVESPPKKKNSGCATDASPICCETNADDCALPPTVVCCMIYVSHFVWCGSESGVAKPWLWSVTVGISDPL
jgi:hypothetical protein